MRRITSFFFSMKIRKRSEKTILKSKIEVDSYYLGEGYEDYVEQWILEYSTKKRNKLLENYCSFVLEDEDNVKVVIHDLIGLLTYLGNLWRRVCGE